MASLKVVCQARSACVVDAWAGKIKEEMLETATFSATGTEVSFIVVPQSTDAVTLTFSVNGNSCSYSLNDLLEQLGGDVQDTLRGGCRLTLNLKLIKGGTDMIVVDDAVIGAWEEQGSVDGEITIKHIS